LAGTRGCWPASSSIIWLGPAPPLRERIVMLTTIPRSPHYDAIVVGARPAGAGTALRLARQGLRVLMVDRGQYGTDTLSTHALMRGAVLQLARWGVLPRVVAAGTPPVRSASFIYAGDALRVPVKPRGGVDALFAPRRTVLDRLLVDAAIEAGVEVAYGTRVIDLVRRADGGVRGVVVDGESGWTRQPIGARVVVGADGMRSRVAQLVSADVTRTGSSASAVVFGYWSGVQVDGYRWYFAPGLSAGAIPTNDGLTCIFASTPSTRFAEIFRADVSGGYQRVLAEVADDLTDTIRGATLVGSLRGFPGRPGFFRRSAGPGWALVGDAGYFKDPLTAHGITDALIEAEYLARAIAADSDEALTAYAADRDRRVAALFEVTDRLASFAWTLDEARILHKRLADAMADEVTALNVLALEGALA
jgi:flavin-dependent dehydrogenase